MLINVKYAMYTLIIIVIIAVGGLTFPYMQLIRRHSGLLRWLPSDCEELCTCTLHNDAYL